MILGLDKIEQLSNETNDSTIYSLSKALQLIIEQNPNMMELLWIDEEDILFSTSDYWLLRQHRNEMLSKLVKYKYSGYAISQLKRIKGHNKWLDKEHSGMFENKPVIKDYLNFIDHSGFMHKGQLEQDKFLFFTKIKDEVYNVWLAADGVKPQIEDGNNFIPVQESYLPEDIHKGILIFNKIQFQKDLEEYNKWQTWKKNRNDVRHDLETKFGYDTKHAMHTFRLLKMGIEILNGEEVQVKRKDRAFLLDIRSGKYTYEQIVEEATKIDTIQFEEAYKNSKLPHSVNKTLYVTLMKKILSM
jgi:predicted nucleotidyltransferase